MSPSTQRAWIEIQSGDDGKPDGIVALHPEGVDRNPVRVFFLGVSVVALHPEGVDRNRLT